MFGVENTNNRWRRAAGKTLQRGAVAVVGGDGEPIAAATTCLHLAMSSPSEHHWRTWESSDRWTSSSWLATVWLPADGVTAGCGCPITPPPGKLCLRCKRLQ